MSVRVYNSILQDLSSFGLSERPPAATQVPFKSMEDESPFCAMIAYMENKSLVSKKRRSEHQDCSDDLSWIDDFAVDAKSFKKCRQLLALDLLGEEENCDDNLSLSSESSDKSHSSDFGALEDISGFLAGELASASFLEDIFTMENERIEA